MFSDGAARNLSDEEVLFKKMFDEYNPSARPVMDSSHTVNVAIQFSLLHIKDLVSQLQSTGVSRLIQTNNAK